MSGIQERTGTVYSSYTDLYQELISRNMPAAAGERDSVSAEIKDKSGAAHPQKTEISVKVPEVPPGEKAAEAPPDSQYYYALIFPGQRIKVKDGLIYTVKKGDTLYDIGLKYNVSYFDLAERNGIRLTRGSLEGIDALA